MITRRRFLGLLASGLALLSVRRLWAKPVPPKQGGYFWRRAALEYARLCAVAVYSTTSNYCLSLPEPDLGVTRVLGPDYPRGSNPNPVTRLIRDVVWDGTCCRDWTKNTLFEPHIIPLLEACWQIGFDAAAKQNGAGLIVPDALLPNDPRWDAAIEYAYKLAAYLAGKAEYPGVCNLGTICLNPVPYGLQWGVYFGLQWGWYDGTRFKSHWKERLKHIGEGAERDMLTLMIRCYDIGHAASIY
jgi:hypothetical protein